MANLSAVVQKRNKSVSLQWVPPSHTGDENILYYKIMHVAAAYAKNEMGNVPWNTTGTTITLSTSAYKGFNNFSVQAVNCNGDGHPAYIKISLLNEISVSVYIVVAVAVLAMILLIFAILLGVYWFIKVRASYVTIIFLLIYAIYLLSQKRIKSLRPETRPLALELENISVNTQKLNCH